MLPSLSSALGHRHKRPKPCAQPGAPHVLSQTAGTPEIAEVSQSSWLPATKMHRRSTFWNLTSLSSRRCARLSGDKARTWSQRALRVRGEGDPGNAEGAEDLLSLKCLRVLKTDSSAVGDELQGAWRALCGEGDNTLVVRRTLR